MHGLGRGGFPNGAKGFGEAVASAAEVGGIMAAAAVLDENLELFFFQKRQVACEDEPG